MIRVNDAAVSRTAPNAPSPSAARVVPDIRRAVLLAGAQTRGNAAIGYALVRSGYRVFCGSASYARAAVAGTSPVRMDVTDASSVEQALDLVLARAGRLDAVVVHDAAQLVGATEATSGDDALSLFDRTVIGVHRLVRASLPALRAARGRCVIVSALGASRAREANAIQSAARSALQAWVQATRRELRPHGVSIAVLEPRGAARATRGSEPSDRSRFIEPMYADLDTVADTHALARGVVDALDRLGSPSSLAMRWRRLRPWPLRTALE